MTHCRLKLDEPRIHRIFENGKTRQQLPDELGLCYHDFFELEPGLGLGQLHYRPAIPLTEETNGPHHGRVMVVTIAMQGRSCYEGKDATRLEFTQGCTTVSAFQAVPGERHYAAGETITQLRIVVHESLVSKYLGAGRAAAVLGHQPLNRLAFRTSTPAAMTHAHALMNQLRPSHGHLSRLDMQIHALSLLNEQFKLLAPQRGGPDSPFSPAEIERLEQVRSLMTDKLDQPLTLDYLAITSGLNRNKLTAGMRYLYNATPAQMLLALRMQRALALLESGQRVSQVSWQVGYQYANNFTVAFTRFHGRSPKAMFGKHAAGH